MHCVLPSLTILEASLAMLQGVHVVVVLWGEITWTPEVASQVPDRERGKITSPDLMAIYAHVSHSRVALETHHWLMFKLLLTESPPGGFLFGWLVVFFVLAKLLSGQSTPSLHCCMGCRTLHSLHTFYLCQPLFPTLELHFFVWWEDPYCLFSLEVQGIPDCSIR